MYEECPFALKSTSVSKEDVDLRCDVVKIESEWLNTWLCDFYNEHYCGEKIQPMSEHFCIKVQDSITKDEKVWLYVRALDDGNFIQTDMYRKGEKNSVLTIVFYNKGIDDGDGRFHLSTYAIDHPEYGEMPEEIMKTYAPQITDAVFYVLFYIQENINNPEYVEETTEVRNVKVRNGKKKARNKVFRRKIYVPRRVVVRATAISTESTQTTTRSNDTKKREYFLSQWKVRAHIRRIVHKDGTVEYIKVNGTIRKRKPHLLERESAVEYVIKKKKK